MRRLTWGLALAATVAPATCAAAANNAASATRAPFGKLADGRNVEIVALDGGHGLRARILTYGATLQTLEVPDNVLDGTVVGKSGHSYRQGDALALEPQVFPDTPNHPSFGSARLDPGQTYRSLILYRFPTAR